MIITLCKWAFLPIRFSTQQLWWDLCTKFSEKKVLSQHHWLWKKRFQFGWNIVVSNTGSKFGVSMFSSSSMGYAHSHSFFPAMLSLNSIFTLSFPGAIGQLLDSLEEIQVLTGAETDDVNFLQSLFENHTLQALLEVMNLSVLKELLWPITAAGSWINWANHNAPNWHMPPALSKNSWANISNPSLFVFAYYSPKLFVHENVSEFR